MVAKLETWRKLKDTYDGSVAWHMLCNLFYLKKVFIIKEVYHMLQRLERREKHKLLYGKNEYYEQLKGMKDES